MVVPSVNVSSHLAVLAAVDPERAALVDARTQRSLTFRELHARSDAIAAGLNGIGIGKGTRVALMVPPSPDFFALTFALLKTAAVPVMIDPGMGVKNLGVCLAEAEPEAFVGIAKAHLARRLLGWGRRSVRTTINVGRGRFFCSRSLRELECQPKPFDPPAVGPNDTAAILFTSGSTGVAKGAVYSHGIFTAQVEMLKAEYGIAPGEVDLCTFPLFALFGPALGMTCIIPDMDASRPATIDPAKTLAAVERYRVTNFFGSPAVIRRLADGASVLALSPPPLRGRVRVGGQGIAGADEVAGLPHPPHPGPPPPGGREKEGEGDVEYGGWEKRAFATVRRVISAGAPASPDVLETFTKAYLPVGVQIYTPYGATEALPVANIGSDEILTETRHLTEVGKGVCVGRPFTGMTVHIIRISDDPIAEWSEDLLAPPGEVGEIVVRGPVVTKRYHNRDAATKLAKIVDAKTSETLHRMGDVGYIDERGRLWFCGRKSHRVVTPEETLFTDMVEPIFISIQGVMRSALVSVTRNGLTEPVICIERESPAHHPDVRVRFNIVPWDELERQLRTQAKGFVHTRPIKTFLLYPGLFPVDVRHNSKIFREKLAVWADKKLGPKWAGGPV
ncbi:MAG: AMP-binding protein [Gemmataceae bacterium]|nr:AMP-binding protein [Gemmataceae bacterium]